jgi:hypothetical protein
VPSAHTYPLPKSKCESFSFATNQPVINIITRAKALIVKLGINSQQITKATGYITSTSSQQNGPFLVIYAPKKIYRIHFARPNHA